MDTEAAETSFDTADAIECPVFSHISQTVLKNNGMTA